MIIAAIRDRLMDYFMQPFAAPGVPQLLSAISKQVSNDQEGNDIAQAPHQFEVWKLGTVDDQGHIHVERVYLCDCSSLIRSRVRPESQDGRAETAIRTSLGSKPTAPSQPTERATTQAGVPQTREPGSAPEGVQALQGAPGGTRPVGGLIETNKTVNKLS